jgi:beta-fructofuranosidase
MKVCLIENALLILLTMLLCNAEAQTKDGLPGRSAPGSVHSVDDRQLLKGNSPFRDAVKVWNFADDAGIKVNGAAKVGVKLKGEDKMASLERGGDGYAAVFNGGWLVTDPGVKVTGKQMTLLVRAWSSTKNWKGTLLARNAASDNYANLLYNSSLNLKNIGFRELTRLKDSNSIEFLWQTDPLIKQASTGFLSDGENNPYKLSRDSLGRNKTWTQQLFPELYPDLREGLLRVAAPVDLVGTEDWHDIIVRFTGPKLEMFVDGVLVDEEYPHGELRHFAAPFLIGAGMHNGVAAPDFRGRIDHMAIWDRALADSEIAVLSGGQEHIAMRTAEINGKEGINPQYWRPEGYNAFFGDPMPFFHDSIFHLFYLSDRKHHGMKWGAGAHSWGHMASGDLSHWKIHPRAIDLTEQTENSLGTGNLVFHNGRYYLYWVNHGRRLVYSDAADHQFSDNIYMATSIDGIHFEKQADPVVRINYLNSGDVNPFVWQASSGDRFYMYISGTPEHGNWYFESVDLRNWEPVKIPALDKIHAACCSYYPWKGGFYWFDWNRGYRKFLEPVEDPGTKLPEFIPITDAWAVPQAAPFTGNRMLMIGFTLPVTVYGSQALIRELVQKPDGTLGLKWPAELIPSSGMPLPLKIQHSRGDVSGDASSLRLSAGEQQSRATCFVEHLPNNMRITMRIVPEPGSSGFGVCVRGQGDYTSGKELCFEPDKKRFRYAIAPDGSDPEPRFSGSSPATLANVTCLDQSFDLDIIVKDDFVDVCIDHQYTLFHQRPEDYARGDRLFFFVRKGSVKFEAISVRPLTE